MSGRRRRSESLWDRKEEGNQTEISGKVPYSSFRGDGSPKRSNSEANNDAGDISGQPFREPMQGNEDISMDNDNNSGRHGMKMDPAFDEWENQYNSRPSDNSYDLPYRSGDRGISGTGNMSKDRDRSRSPHRIRGRDRDRGSTRGLARSRSRSRSRSRGRGRSPFSAERKESYESGDSRVSSRPCKDFAAGNCRRGIQCRFLHQELVDSGGGDLMEKHSGGSRFRDDKNSKGSDGYRKDSGRKSGVDHTTSSGDDYHRGNRNAYDDQDHRRQSNQTTRAPCRFFIMGKCNRTNCKFSHDVPKSGGYEGRSNDNNSRAWNERQPQDQVSGSGFSDFPKSSSGHDFDDKNKPWNGPLWNDLESGGFDELSRDNILDDKNRTWDDPPGWNGSEKNSEILSQPRSVTNYMDMNQESQLHSQHVMPETSANQIQKQGEGSSVSMMIDSHNMVSGQTNQQIHPYGSDFIPNVHNMAFQYPSTLNGTEKSSDISSLNGPKIQPNGSVQGMFLHMDLQKQTDIQNKQGGKPLETSKNDIPQVMPQSDANVASNEQVSQVSLPQISQNLKLANALELLYSLPNTAPSGPPVDSMVVQQNLDTKSREQYESSRDMVVNESINISAPMGILSNSMEHGNQVSVEQVTSIDEKQEPVGILEVNENRKADKNENTNTGKSEAQGKVEEGNISADEKAMRQFKVALVEFVKEILKPTWKEGKMSREVYKTIVKKVVDKVTSTIQGNQIPRTQEKVDQYLTFSKSKITKLVEAYVGRFLKA